MNRLFFAAVLGFLALPALGQPAVEFRGVPLGASEAVLVAAVPGFGCLDGSKVMPGMYIDRLCSLHSESPKAAADALDFGGARAKSFMALFVGDRLMGVNVSLAPESVSTVTEALEAKFGSPSSVAEPVFATRGGLRATNRVVTWQIGDDSITARKYGRAIDEGVVEYRSDAMSKAWAEKRKAGAQASKGTL